METHAATLPAVRPPDPLWSWGEDVAVEHLQRVDGLRVVDRNWSLRTGEVRGELDVVAVDDRRGLLVVVEVKTRRSDRHGGPLLAVTGRKQAQVRTLTAAYLRTTAVPHRRVRLDVVGVLQPGRGPGRLDHVVGAI